jgi:pimeloyl-ACP methyl ester carboxylesterase
MNMRYGTHYTTPPVLHTGVMYTLEWPPSSVSVATALLLAASIGVLARWCVTRPPNKTTPTKRPWPTPPVPESTVVVSLKSREFVRDMARLAEGIVMNDVGRDYWEFDDSSSTAAADLRLKFRCRETAPMFAPDRCGDQAEKPPEEAGSCAVRWQRAMWSIDFKRRYHPSVIDWIDTGVNQEKQCAILLLQPKGAPPIVAVAFRGSKSLQDYVRTDISPRFVPLPSGFLAGDACDASDRSLISADTVDADSARLMPFLANADTPCVTLGLWRAYAGEAERDRSGTGPRGRVRYAVERLLQQHPDAQLVITGHSLGGALATVCAFDLITQSAIIRNAEPVTMVSYAAPRMFNRVFQDVMAELEASGALRALRVVVGSDIIARIPPKMVGAEHGVRARLLLHPDDTRRPISFCVDDPDDKDLWWILPDATHCCHALYLGGETTPTLKKTCPKSYPWPVVTPQFG